jgi:hypothetical protein
MWSLDQKICDPGLAIGTNFVVAFRENSCHKKKGDLSKLGHVGSNVSEGRFDVLVPPFSNDS